jgi:hypothetical protein
MFEKVIKPKAVKVDPHVVCNGDGSFDLVTTLGREPMTHKQATHLFLQLRHHAKYGHLRGKGK